MPAQTANVHSPTAPMVPRVISAQDATIKDAIRQLAEFSHMPPHGLERRAFRRVAFPRLIEVTPLADDGLTPADESFCVVGKNLAPLGLDFFHRQPIPQRYALASLEVTDEQTVHVVMKITWCRFLRSGWYDGGGRFVKLVEWTPENAEDASD